MSEFRSILVTNTPSVNVKPTGADVLSLNIVNRHNAAIFVKFYNSPTATFQDTPFRTYEVAASLGSTLYPTDSTRALFSTTSGLCIRCTTSGTDSDSTAPATLPIIELQYN